MTDQATTEAVRHSVTVPIDRERAFRLFTEEIDSWWPTKDFTISGGPVTEMFEPREGGRWYELAEDGSEATVATVLAWEPPARFVMAWQLTPEWQPEPNVERATKVEVTFEEQEGGGTRVSLEHRGFEAYAERGGAMREQVDSEGGWPALLGHYADVAGS